MKYDILPRLLKFTHESLELLDNLGLKCKRQFVADQFTRASLSSVLNYSEAISAESRKDFIHKMSIALKELRESRSCLLLLRMELTTTEFDEKITAMLKENDELIAIFVKSIITAKSNLNKQG